jgi:hypothetical protein
LGKRWSRYCFTFGRHSFSKSSPGLDRFEGRRLNSLQAPSMLIR